MRLLDLFCGAGGAGMGYHRAGWSVTGVDINHLAVKYYPFRCLKADAFDVLSDGRFLAGFDAIHASPPCQHYSPSVADKSRHPDLLGPTREALQATGLPWVMENVPQAPMRWDLLLCGSQFRLPGLIRHRAFEVSWAMTPYRPECRHPDKVVSVVGHGPNSHSPYRHMGGGPEWAKLKRDAMGIDWPMNRDLLAEAIPPHYTHFVAGLMGHLFS